jgi:pyruvate/2-oxoglutarate/acetoin dehydrogenase E1 component/TPP-dependent pyruvate/acetoin dehydrogenase alpha subunit
MTDHKLSEAKISVSSEDILYDYRIAYQSRQVSLAGRREVMSGKAKFGIFGDGKELAQVALARSFKKGDFRSGYYRDQTLLFALGALSIQEFFAQLYAHADVTADPASAGRAMNAHFATRSLNPDGTWKNLVDRYNTSSDISPTGSQMSRLVGLAYASRLYRELAELKSFSQFSDNGNEIAFGTIGNATTAEGVFWEAVNAIGVLHSPAIISIWDDEYGISVHNRHQMLKEDIGELLSGFQREPGKMDGYDLYKVKGWDYVSLVETYQRATEIVRREHVPAIVHVIELTQPQGHSTSGSHERYKPKERLEWEREHDCLKKFKDWIIEENIASAEELDQLEKEARNEAEAARKAAWQAYIAPIVEERKQLIRILEEMSASTPEVEDLSRIKSKLETAQTPLRRDLMIAVRDALLALRAEQDYNRRPLIDWKKEQETANRERYSSFLYSRSSKSPFKISEIPAVYSDGSPVVHGFEILNACFDKAFEREPRLIAFGQDVGRLGDVNQGFKGLQEKYGKLRVSDTGIRENTIIGQAIGMAMRGLRPIAEIQYLDYLLYALQIMSDDLATLHWRTHGGQKAPVIIRTRGHRLEGIWHSGSPMAGVIHLVRGMHVLVPRNMTQAAGFYNTLIQSDDPAVVVEVLNAYRLREKMPDNIDEISLPLGVPETLREGSDVTLVTYGACCRLAMEAADLLEKVDIDAEVVDVQSLLPFDTGHKILDSLKKTNRILFLDEDVPGGTTAFMMQEVLENQGGYYWLDSEPRTLSAQPHRPAYGSDGDYWSKPNVEDIFYTVYDMMHEADPGSYPLFYR